MQQTAEGEKRVKSEDGDTTASGGQASVDAVSQGSLAALRTRRPLTLAEGLIHLRLADQCSKLLLARVEAFNVSRPFTRPSIHHRTDAHMQHIKAHYENKREGGREIESVKTHIFIGPRVSHSTHLYASTCTFHSYIRQWKANFPALLPQRR